MPCTARASRALHSVRQSCPAQRAPGVPASYPPNPARARACAPARAALLGQLSEFSADLAHRHGPSHAVASKLRTLHRDLSKWAHPVLYPLDLVAEAEGSRQTSRLGSSSGAAATARGGGGGGAEAGGSSPYATGAGQGSTSSPASSVSVGSGGGGWGGSGAQEGLHAGSADASGFSFRPAPSPEPSPFPSSSQQALLFNASPQAAGAASPLLPYAASLGRSPASPAPGASPALQRSPSSPAASPARLAMAEQAAAMHLMAQSQQLPAGAAGWGGAGEGSPLAAAPAAAAAAPPHPASPLRSVSLPHSNPAHSPRCAGGACVRGPGRSVAAKEARGRLAGGGHLQIVGAAAGRAHAHARVTRARRASSSAKGAHIDAEDAEESPSKARAMLSAIKSGSLGLGRSLGLGKGAWGKAKKEEGKEGKEEGKEAGGAEEEESGAAEASPRSSKAKAAAKAAAKAVAGPVAGLFKWGKADKA